MAWFGWCSKNRNCGSGKGKNVGSIMTHLKGCGKAKLDVGKCTKTKHNEAINVYLDDNIVGTVPANNFRKIVDFDFKDGSKCGVRLLTLKYGIFTMWGGPQITFA